MRVILSESQKSERNRAKKLRNYFSKESISSGDLSLIPLLVNKIS
jgi:hypothetical protein